MIEEELSLLNNYHIAKFQPHFLSKKAPKTYNFASKITIYRIQNFKMYL